MKLRIDRSPDDSKFLFKVDTHDRHVMPGPESPEHAAFVELGRYNQELAGRIEAAWSTVGIPTFKSWLAADLERRRRTINPSPASGSTPDSGPPTDGIKR